MKIKLALLTTAILIGVFMLTNTWHKEEQLENRSQWHAEYLKKQERHKKGLPGNKKMRIAEIEKYFKGLRTKFGEDDSHYPANYLMTELELMNKGKQSLKSTEEINWIHRGPGNVGGRTRAVVVDVTDPTHNTWFAGSASGGAWKTIDGGSTWENISEDIPYHAVSTIAQSITDPNILYIGTGESFSGGLGTTGGGIFKSIDKGDTWTQLDATASNDDFRYVNRLTIDPDNEDIILAATNSGIYKSIDGGLTWIEKYKANNNVEDIKADTSDFNYIYAGVNSEGIVKSVDAGETWKFSNNGIFGANGRFEIAISPSNSNWLYISVENMERGSDVYVTTNKGDEWTLIKNSVGDAVDYLGGQPGYDNAIAVHPFYEDTVFVAGVNSWKIGVNDIVLSGEGTITKFDTTNTSSFLAFVNFGTNIPGLSTGDEEDALDLLPEDYVSVEVRFGPGMTQKAHRFTVPNEATSGVPYTDYAYADYVDVPFEVWDVTNNKQLMCSFRDQEKDGEFNLYERTGDGYGELGREYLFINAVDYNATTPDANIAVQGGRSYKLIYFMWPELISAGVWDDQNLPDSKVFIEYSYPDLREGNVINVSDAYDEYSGRNTYNQSKGLGTTSIPGFHPDHHALTVVAIDKNQNKFWIVSGNDGGLAISKDNGYTFEQIKNGYTTTQVYNVSKKPYRNEYIGGMQDNGTWQSPSFTEASIDEDFLFRIGGDGFETIWRLDDTNQIMGSLYNNDIYRTNDHGNTWYSANSGIDDGPFITKLTMLPSKPRQVYAVGTEGLYSTTNFGVTSWKTISMPEGWVPEGWDVTSSHQIKYSIANDSILWAGAAITEEFDWKIFVSTDAGSSFMPIAYPEDTIDAFISNIATHPTEPETAYLIYSLFAEPKILRTTDLGQTWEDITGFDESGTSNNGFPDVGCMSVFVFPDDTDRIWVGTELGIVESLDNGVSWNLLESNLPTVPVWQIFMQDNQVVIATYGRGIWTYQYGDVVTPPVTPPTSDNAMEAVSGQIKVYPNPSTGIFNIELVETDEVGEVIVQVRDINGRIIQERNSNRNKVVQIDLTEFNTGNYFVVIRTDVGVYTQKVMKY